MGIVALGCLMSLREILIVTVLPTMRNKMSR